MPQEASGLILTGLLGTGVGILLRQPQVDRLTAEVVAGRLQLSWKEIQLTFANRSLESKDQRIAELERGRVESDREHAQDQAEIARLRELSGASSMPD